MIVDERALVITPTFDGVTGLGSGGFGLVIRAAANLPTIRVLTGTSNQITVTNGDGVSGNPTMSLPSAITLPGSLTMGGSLSLGSTGQIQFPATQNASAGANVLDDYEEGTWTPSLGGTATYTQQNGSYTKIGRSVSFNTQLNVNAIGTGSTTVVSGLPFTSGSGSSFPQAAVSLCLSLTLATAVVSLDGFVTVAGTTVTVNSRTAASASTASNAIFTANTQLGFSGTYFVV